MKKDNEVISTLLLTKEAETHIAKNSFFNSGTGITEYLIAEGWN